jgi:DNA primase
VGFIAPETIEQIAAANDIVEVIGSYLPLKRAGSSYRALCPFHQERSPSFHVNQKRQSYHCFGCGAGGSVFRFVMEYEKLDFPSAARKLAERAGIRVIEEAPSPEADRRSKMRRRLLELHNEAAHWFHENLLAPEIGGLARTYLKRRGINREIAVRWAIGYAPDAWEECKNWAKGRGYSDEELLQSGLVKPRDEDSPGKDVYDRFRGRVMFPIRNPQGEVIAFSGRVLDPEATAAKYLNSPETMLFTKGAILFGLEKTQRAIIEKDSAIVCEGQLDLITAFEAGITNVTAAQGTAFTPQQARILKRYASEVVLCFDSDTAGQKAAARSLPALLEADLAVRILPLPPGEDPDSLIRGEGVDPFRQRVGAAQDFFDYQLDRFGSDENYQTPRGKVVAAQELAGFVRLVRNPIARETLVNKVAARLDIGAGDFQRILAQPQPHSGSAEPPPRAKKAPPADMTIHLLCVLALHVPGAAEMMRERRLADRLAELDGTELLRKIIGSGIDPEREPTVSAFMSQLDAAEEAAVATLLLEEPPAEPDQVLDDCCAEIERRVLRRRLGALHTQMRQPGLGAARVVELQKEVLDLQGRLTDITRPFSRPPSEA